MNFIPLREVIIANDASILGAVAEERAAGGYSSTYGLLLNAKELYQKPANTLWTLIHEELHAISVTPIQRNISSGELTRTVDKRKLGVTVKTDEYVSNMSFPNASKVEYYNFNEGITELLSEKIFSEYLKRSGDAEQFGRGAIADERANSYSNRIYGRYRQMVDVYVAVLAILHETDEDTTEQAILRTYLRNGDILPSEYAETLASDNPDLLSELRYIINEPQLFSFDDMYTWSNELRERGTLSEVQWQELQAKLNVIRDRIATDRAQLKDPKAT